MKLNLNIETKISGKRFNVGVELAQSFRRINVQDELGIRKIQVYINYLEKGNAFELDDADFKQFKDVVVASDTWQAIKMEVLRVYDKIEK